MEFFLSSLNHKILKRLWQGKNEWHDSNWTSEGVSYYGPWINIEKKEIYTTDFLKHFSSRNLLVKLGRKRYQPASAFCGVSQDSVLGSLLFLIHANANNDMIIAVKSHLFHYADDSCLICQRKDVNKIEILKINEIF